MTTTSDAVSEAVFVVYQDRPLDHRQVLRILLMRPALATCRSARRSRRPTAARFNADIVTVQCHCHSPVAGALVDGRLRHSGVRH